MQRYQNSIQDANQIFTMNNNNNNGSVGHKILSFVSKFFA